jgi:hypothetical protein
MNQYGVSTADMAAATGSNVEDIQSRYDAVTPAAAVEEPAADPYQQAYEPPAPVATSPFVSAFAPSNFVEPVDEPVAPVAAPESRGIASLPPPATTAPEQPPIVEAGITSLAPPVETPPVVQPEGILSGVVAPTKPTDQEIVKFLTDNPNTSDADIAKIMQDTGLKPEDIARATGAKVEDVTNRYEAVAPTTPEAPTGIATLADAAVKDPTQTGNVLSGNILAGASWNSLNPTLAGQLTEATGQSTTDTSVGGATTGETLKQLKDFTEAGGSFAPGSTVFLQTGGLDLVYGENKNTIQDNLDQIITDLEKRGVKVVLTGSPFAASFDDVKTNNFNPELDSIYTNVANKHSNVALVDSMGTILKDKSLLSDFIHPNEKGWEVYNKSVLDAYSKLSGTEKAAVESKLAATGASNPLDAAKVIDSVAGTKIANTATVAQAKEVANETQSPTGIATLTPVQPVAAAAPEIKYGTDKYTKTQVTDYIGGVMNDTKLAPWEKTNKIMESAQKAGMTTEDLKSIYGKDVVDSYLKDYGAGIKSYITDTLADPKKSDFEKLAAINQAADKYGLDPKEISSYAGMNEKGVQKVFESFETGLKSIVTNLSAPTVSDIDKTKGALQLQSKYGITDDQIAKALGGDMTGKDVKAYLDPVKNFAPKFQEITTDNTKTASDIRSFIDDAKKDPRISGLYGLAIQNAEKMLPVLGLRDSMAGKGTPEELTKGYTDFVAAVNADPSLKEKYGAQADAIDKVAKMSQRIADEQFGGKLQPHMFQTFIGLDQKTLGDIPKTLEMTPGETKSITDNEGNTQTYTTPGTLKDTKGYEPVYTTTGSGDTETKELAGYTKPIKTSAGVTVDAQYDAQGNLTGYRGRPEDKIWPAHRVGVTGVWDADGKAKPEQKVETPGFAKSMLQDIQALGPIGQLIIAAGTGGLGSLAAGALQSSLGPMLAKAVGSGLVSGAMSEIGGGKFGKGFLTGAIGNPIEALTQNLTGGLMPNIDTGNAMLNDYVSKALPNLASSTVGALVNKKDVGDAAFGSLLNTGTNMAANSLISGAMPDTLTPEVKNMFTGVSGQLLSDLLKGQTPDVQKAVMGTIVKNAMSSGRDTATGKSTAKGKTMGDDEINFGDLDSGEGAFDISSLLGGSSGVDLSGIDLGPEAFDISSLLGGDEGTDLSALDLGPEAFDISSLLGGGDGREIDFSKILGDDGKNLGIDTTGLDAGDTFDLSALTGSKDDTGLSRSLASTDKDTSGGTGLKATGRGQMSIVDPETGATGIKGEGFTSVDDLLGSGTKDEIDRYSPGTADYSLRSGSELKDGQGLSPDSTRGMSLDSMGGGQGLSKYVPAQYEKGSTTPIKGTGGTLSETGFLADSSKANPLGSKYAIGDAKSSINNPTVTGQQSVVSPGRTIIDNKDGTYKVVTNTKDGGTKTVTATKEEVNKIIKETPSTPVTPKTPTTPTKPDGKKDNNMLMMLLALMAMMNKGGGGKSTGAGSTIPMLSANRSQLPYGPVSGGPAARPGAGGVNYFSPTTYTPKAAGGGLMSLAGGGMSNLGGYSDGGRLLKGPGDGVSDSIPATIGGKQPARLATGEFVVPARIVSELGNGSTDAGAQRLYAMMDRVQKARRKTKNVAADTKARKHLPA